ncbi:putative proline-rich receptor-like protein kinase PERK13 [Iris pallida]|uniref:Proline-rich receptor-like protein kinase PERK13 n=1 Tax=Iris pallida TaxID=29817 RepID=A0AAX6I469_IRIPA|nr:putative proline-rich receptor-like protein kinase PERK13 [Iris pallida]
MEKEGGVMVGGVDQRGVHGKVAGLVVSSLEMVGDVG